MYLFDTHDSLLNDMIGREIGIKGVRITQLERRTGGGVSTGLARCGAT